MKKWNKYNDGYSLPTYSLTREANPEWFAKVFPYDGRYTFTIGKRVKDGEPTPPRYNWLKKGWKSAETAKKKALWYITLKSNEEK